MRLPRVSIAGLMALVAVFALTWVAVRAALQASEWVTRHSLTLCYSTVPDRRSLPKEEPVYPDYRPILDSDAIGTGLGLLAFGGTPMLSLLGIAAFLVLRGLVLRGRCSPFLLGFVVAGSATLAAYLACCVLETGSVEYCAATLTNLLLCVPDLFADHIGDDVASAFFYAAVMTVLGVPQLLLALLGGVLNERKLRVVLQVLPRTADDPVAT
jgi:hypothetical protein